MSDGERFDYQQYLRSPAWLERRRLVLLRANGICEECHQWPIVNVHHLTYARLGNEPLEDLQGVCSRCHRNHHKGLSS